MKLLFDQNLSFRLPQALADIYQGALHVRHLALTEADDKEIWLYAAANDCVIVSKDSDFYQRSLLHGHPPKVDGFAEGTARPGLLNRYCASIGMISNGSCWTRLQLV